jgi:hypothetical protein
MEELSYVDREQLVRLFARQFSTTLSRRRFQHRRTAGLSDRFIATTCQGFQPVEPLTRSATPPSAKVPKVGP